MASNIERSAAWPIAIAISMALVLSSLFISYAIGEFGSPDRFVQVKGLAERDPSSPHVKLVRVVTTIDYDLEGGNRID